MERNAAINTYEDLFSALDTEVLAKGLDGSTVGAVRTMRSRGRIDNKFWLHMLRMPELLSIGLTPEALGRCEVAWRERQEREATEPELPGVAIVKAVGGGA